MSRYDGLKPIPVSPWRWVALLALIAEYAHERVHAWGAGPSLQATLDGQISSIGPGGSVFGAWTAVQLMLIWYGLAQLVEEQRQIAAHDRLSRLIVGIAVLSGVRTSVEHNVGLSAVVSLAGTAVAAGAYLRIRRAIAEDRASGFIGVPFSLLLGWSSIVTAAWILAVAGTSNARPAVTLLAFVAGTAMHLGLQLRDYVLPGCVAWLVFASCATGRLSAPVATCALLAGTLCSIVAIVIAATRLSRPRPAASPSPSPRFPRA